MTILERLTDHLHLSEERARSHLKASFVRVDGRIVRDPDAELADTARLTLQPPPVTEHV
mgnify:CR=1 FL=1